MFTNTSEVPQIIMFKGNANNVHKIIITVVVIYKLCVALMCVNRRHRHLLHGYINIIAVNVHIRIIIIIFVAIGVIVSFVINKIRLLKLLTL